MNILFVIGAPFPYGAAWSSRARNLAKLFMLCGHSVHVISTYTKEKDYSIGSIRPFDGYTYQALKQKVKFLDRFYLGKKSNSVVKRYMEKHKVDLLFMSSNPERFSWLLRQTKKHRIPLILEQCEWFDPSSYKIGKWDPFYRKSMRCINTEYQKSNGIVSISRLFEDHYKSKGTNTVRIPTILDSKSTKVSYHNIHEKVQLSFAGNLGRSKELLEPVVRALSESPELQEKFDLQIYGPNKEQVLSNLGASAENYKELFNRCIYVHGMIPQISIESKVREADFSIFVRPQRRSSNAGFPTKFAESLMVGTPVITNATGDIPLYLKDGLNGFMLDDNSSDSVRKTLFQILQLTSDEYKKMRYYARKTAEEHFDYRIYKDQITDLIEKSLKEVK